MTHIEVNCPICDSGKYSPIYPDKHIVKCMDCSLVYLRIRLDEKSMYELYQGYANESSHMRLPKTVEDIRNSGLRRQPFMEAMQHHAGQWRDNDKLLDVGCGWGAFLHNARDKGFEPWGVEITESCVEFARRVIGIPVILGGVEMCHQEHFSVVTSIHSLEHLPNPAQALRNTYDKLKPGGWFCGIVPNFDSLCSRMMLEDWKWLDPDYHYTYWTPDVLRSTLTRFGFTDIQFSSTSGDYGTKEPEAAASLAGPPLRVINGLLQGEELWFFCRKPEAIKPKLSFVTTCKNRLYALKQTLPQNLQDNPEPWVEFVVLDYSSDDGVGEWLREIQSGLQGQQSRLTYFRSAGQPYFHMAHSKNCAHRLASGDLQCNLDADNFTGQGFASYLVEQLATHRIVHGHLDGANGRIAMRKEDFITLGGYDESLMGYGWDDNDLTARASKSGFGGILMDSKYQLSIPTDTLERNACYPTEYSNTLATNLVNKLRSESNIEQGKFVANEGKNWGSIIVQKNWKDYISI